MQENKQSRRGGHVSGAFPFAVSMEDAPRLFGISKAHIYRKSKEGKIELKKVGRKTLVMTDSVINYLQGLPFTEGHNSQPVNPQ